MKWDIEERTEDAIVAYLQSRVTGDMRVYAAWDGNQPQLPCAVVHAGQSELVSEEAEWHDPRQITVNVAVMSEAAPEVSSTGNTIRTARERNAVVRSDVMEALASTSLLTNLIATKTEAVAFSMAQLSGCVRDVDSETRTLITTLTVDVIAEPVEDS